MKTGSEYEGGKTKEVAMKSFIFLVAMVAAVICVFSCGGGEDTSEHDTFVSDTLGDNQNSDNFIPPDNPTSDGQELCEEYYWLSSEKWKCCTDSCDEKKFKCYIEIWGCDDNGCTRLAGYLPSSWTLECHLNCQHVGFNDTTGRFHIFNLPQPEKLELIPPNQFTVFGYSSENGYYSDDDIYCNKLE